MPNWCSATFTISASKDSCDILEREIAEALSTNPVGSDFGNEWLGNLLLRTDLLEYEVKYGDIRCRGWVSYWDRAEDEVITIQTDHAWCPPAKCIEKFAKHFAPDAEVIYTAEEPGSELYWTNDPAVAGMVLVDFCGVPEDMEACLWEEEVPESKALKYLRDYLGHDGTLDALTNEMSEIVETQAKDKDAYIRFYQYKFVPIEKTT